jgi:hypothetical protein
MNLEERILGLGSWPAAPPAGASPLRACAVGFWGPGGWGGPKLPARQAAAPVQPAPLLAHAAWEAAPAEPHPPTQHVEHLARVLLRRRHAACRVRARRLLLLLELGRPAVRLGLRQLLSPRLASGPRLQGEVAGGGLQEAEPAAAAGGPGRQGCCGNGSRERRAQPAEESGAPSLQKRAARQPACSRARGPTSANSCAQAAAGAGAGACCWNSLTQGGGGRCCCCCAYSDAHPVDSGRASLQGASPRAAREPGHRGRGPGRRC